MDGLLLRAADRMGESGPNGGKCMSACAGAGWIEKHVGRDDAAQLGGCDRRARSPRLAMRDHASDLTMARPLQADHKARYSPTSAPTSTAQ